MWDCSQQLNTNDPSLPSARCSETGLIRRTASIRLLFQRNWRLTEARMVNLNLCICCLWWDFTTYKDINSIASTTCHRESRHISKCLSIFVVTNDANPCLGWFLTPKNQLKHCCSQINDAKLLHQLYLERYRIVSFQWLGLGESAHVWV